MKTITRSRAGDRTLFLGLLILLLVYSPLLRVYFEGTDSEVSVVSVDAEGVRATIETPEPFQGIQPGIYSTRRSIREFGRSEAGLKLTPEGGYLEWSIRYVQDAKYRKDGERKRLIVTSPDDAGE